MTPRLRALSPAVMEKAVSVWKQELANGLTPEGALVIVLSETLPVHAHELAEKQRDMLRGGFRMPGFATILTAAGHEPLGTTHVIDHIDPEITTVRPARVALAELTPEDSNARS